MVFGLIGRWLDKKTEDIIMDLVDLAPEPTEGTVIKNWKNYTSRLDSEIEAGRIDTVGVSVIRVPGKDHANFAYFVRFEARSKTRRFVHNGYYGIHTPDDQGLLEASHRAIYTAAQCLREITNPMTRHDFSNTDITLMQYAQVLDMNERDMFSFLGFNGRNFERSTIDTIVETCQKEGWEPFPTSGDFYETRKLESFKTPIKRQGYGILQNVS